MSAIRILLFVLGVLLLMHVGPTAAAGETFSHEDWTAVLSLFVDERGLVDYAGLARDRGAFDRYIAAVETVSPLTDPKQFPDRDHELAYYINAYNAMVFKGVLDRGPEDESVWRGGLVSGYAFFVGMKITVGGRRSNLKKLEDKTIRAGYQDPRVHAALNCASLSCPRLPRSAFDPERLDEQFDRAMREFVSDERHVRIDEARRVVRLSKIFDWFTKDFIDYETRAGNPDPNLIDFINRYRPTESRIPRDYRIKFLPYDKDINKQS